MIINKLQVVHRLCAEGIVAVIRAEDSEQAIKIAEACLRGGISSLEITFTIPRAHQVIEALSNHFSPGEVTIGAGTVLDPETARIAILSGAQFIVSPYVNTDTIQLCNRYGIPCMPGAMTVKEAIEGMEAGADIIKLFPGETYGPSMIRSLKGPLPQINLMPTGGVNLETITDWLEAGAVAVGVGGSLISSAKQGDYATITEKSRQLVEKVKTFHGVYSR
ncbi:bifunctional 2-keto-4-hydroxyglutarate aldolase/2-keto-3-deoxy-6-phosphogluconate aldolase [Neobacillus sp. MER 74]|uniref:bifunctional 2-keto-4-hydroxyglutarate aldolase/2-keto-3-deoxy-6-phosphogluconate aldolase n=1 Tax=Neobacillus sp. MER 74 TaxID=2939566 RepID=UPI00203E6EF4|nr:bifunctional 2-keto-4-hydroxyglutarate aldolase/2-keto-3-deoxy-6-phosphogluconate aldolase [Neobacillus sp. MER 74]MCM3118085.1 bifunctional 2-keto-4-hydroxyglutarate aldolase/2-keto-3-deoxy-6-phosphogluconate aldolase [Neobacillus sp. MER 74]